MKNLALLKKADHQSLPLVLSDMIESNSMVNVGNVFLLLDNQVKLQTHLCFLSSSSLVKNLFMNIELRLEKESYISLPGYSEKTVRQLLQFLHRGFVAFEDFENQQEFLELCLSLELNPPVLKEGGVEDAAEEEISEEPVKEVDNEMAINNNCELENDYYENLQSPGSADIPQLHLSDNGDSDEETPEHISEFINQLSSNLIQSPSAEDEVRDNVADGLQQSENEAHKEDDGRNNNSVPSFITDFTSPVSEGFLDSSHAEDSSMCEDDTFKMPDSFDIPSEYINELLPSSSKSISLKVAGDSSPIKNISDSKKADDRKSEVTLNENSTKEKKLNFDDIAKLIPDENLDNDNTPVQDEVVQITYKKDAGSRRNKGSKSNSEMDPRKDRKKIMADLFNDSDSSDKEESSTSSSTNLLNELEEKRNRMKSKLKTSGGENIKKKNSTREEVSKMFNMTTSTTSNPSSSKSQSIHAVRRQRNEEDEKFIASDNSSLSESELSDADSETEAEDRRKRLDVRKKKKGGDVLAWMSRRAKVSVIVQTSPRAYIQDMAQYRMRLLAEGDSEDSDVPSSTSRRSRKSSGEEKTPKSRMSTSSDDSIPRGKRISALKSSESEDEEMKKRRKKLKKKKDKKTRIHTPVKDFPVEEVIWTPSMYQKWDKMSTNTTTTKRKIDSGDSDGSKSSKHKIKYQRSSSIDLKKSSSSPQKQKTPVKSPKFQRSVSSYEVGNSKSKISLPSASSLPKIPKFKKSD